MFFNSTVKDFDKFAEDVVSSFLVDSVPLGDAIIKVANAQVLNPEEVKRLVEKSNTLATIKMIKASSEGTLEFDMASFDKVSKETHPEGAPTPPVPAQPIESDIPAIMINTQKTASAGEQFFTALLEPGTQSKVASESEPITLTQVFSCKKSVEEAGRKKVAAELSFRKSLDNLLSDFSSLYSPDFQKFASEACTLYGPTSLPILDALASGLKEPTGFTKQAAVVNDIDNPQLDMFKEAHEALTDICKLSQDLVTHKLELSKAWDNVKNGAVA